MKFDKYFWQAASIVIFELLFIIVVIFPIRYEWMVNCMIWVGLTCLIVIMLTLLLLVTHEFAEMLSERGEK